MPDKRPSRVAFTLLELLIVLAILAGMAALSWPAIRGLLARSELHSAAKQVRASLARARLDAMESGGVRQFRYQADTGRFEITVVAGSDGEDARAGPSGSDDRKAERPAENALPSGVRFKTPGGSDELRELPGSAALPGEANWSEPVWFFSNGRTSNARLRLAGRRDYFVDLSLRGVTGIVTIGKVEQAEDWP